MYSQKSGAENETADVSPAGAVGNNLTVQRKLTIGAVNDPLEAEADAVADKVVRMPEPAIQRKCTHCAEEEKAQRKPLASVLQRKETAGNGTASDAVAHQIGATKGSGSRLDAATKSFMESRFGADFSGIRIHSNQAASQLSGQLNAQAFTAGRDVYFAKGKYAPETPEGKHLLAHELTHSIQQGASSPWVQRQAAPAPKKTIWINIGFDSSAQANEETMTKLRASIAAEQAALTSCCGAHATACNVQVKTNYDWVRYNKPAPADGDYDSDKATDRTLRDKNFDKIEAPQGGLKVLVTESTLSQTWQGARIFPRANTSTKGVLWNRALAANDTIAHEGGHAAGYTGNAEGGSHSSDPHNLMSPGSVRAAGAAPDQNWCTQMEAAAR